MLSHAGTNSHSKHKKQQTRTASKTQSHAGMLELGTSKRNTPPTHPLFTSPSPRRSNYHAQDKPSASFILNAYSPKHVHPHAEDLRNIRLAHAVFVLWPTESATRLHTSASSPSRSTTTQRRRLLQSAMSTSSRTSPTRSSQRIASRTLSQHLQDRNGMQRHLARHRGRIRPSTPPIPTVQRQAF